MSTNYYRIPTETEMIKRRETLSKRASELDISHTNISNGFETIIGTKNMWDKFRADTYVHLGKSSAGWKFLWNFHDNKYYFDKDSLFEFIRDGRVINEYGQLIPNEEFIQMALNHEPNGKIINKEYFLDNGDGSIFEDPKYYDKVIDGLRVSAFTEFS